ncbi:tryptophan 2,3-dioxygenase [Thermoactinomyces sp. DSM 45892]|uniref:tryptophan 2,3-dioxygenase n=1 Tax=Thermoactinomyces sp. DSM 45892 TaxID=1882753 RepID=UPI00089D05D2|nr:tryptophan 2,3-dioxygenase [Thermoactinomyces sp. DSM 45892]SDZ30200.1 tryptophan 2,3-dioxygenase [Thermoactinomyces sp. DSM 45892]
MVKKEGLEQTERPEGIQTNFRNNMTYGDYLQLDQILDAQNPLSNHHDEMLFVIIHQTSELWMKQMIHELQAAIQHIVSNRIASALKMLSRVSRIQSQVIQSWDVLSTLTPAEYIEFRNSLGESSGFQSYQYRIIEFYLGKKSTPIMEIYSHKDEVKKMLEGALQQPSLYDVAIQALANRGFTISPSILDRDWTKPYQSDESVEKAWLEVYQDVNQYWIYYQLAEKLVDIEDWMQQWRFRHMKTVERIIGFKRGTGGSPGVPYLRSTMEHRFFPELWDLRTKL